MMFENADDDEAFCNNLLIEPEEMEDSDFRASAMSKIESLSEWMEKRPLTEKQRIMMHNIASAVEKSNKDNMFGRGRWGEER